MDNGPPLPWTVSEILKATGGELLCGGKEHRFDAVCIDSRSIAANDLFVAIVGDVHDGHAFISDVVNQGTGGLLVNTDRARDLPISAWQTRDIACVAVRDTTRGVGRSGSLSSRTNRCGGDRHYRLKRQNHCPSNDGRGGCRKV